MPDQRRGGTTVVKAKPNSAHSPTAIADLWPLVRHDFRQATHSLRGIAPLIGTTRDEDELRDLGRMVAAVAGAVDCMADVLQTLATVEAERASANKGTCGLTDLAEGLSAEFAPLFESRRLKPETAYASVLAQGDDVLAAATMRGIILTAVKLSSNGSLRLATSAEPPHGLFSVIYSGIDPAAAFERSAFVELPAMSAENAAPLVGPGLAMASRMARLLGGMLSSAATSDGRHEIKLTLKAAG
jgi:two-component system, sensor histidine kinase LadS